MMIMMKTMIRITTMMMFGVSCVNNVWWEVEEGALGNSNERLPQVQAQPHFSDTNPFSPTDVIFQNLQRSPCFLFQMLIIFSMVKLIIQCDKEDKLHYKLKLVQQFN